jgi:predicted RNase H-like HicB family nuclease
MYEFSVLIHSAPDVEGAWIAHCLNLDVVTFGDSPKHAFEMVVDALAMVIQDDVEAGRDPLERKSAPQECWQMLEKIEQRGERCDAQSADKAADEPDGGRHVFFSVRLRMQFERRAVSLPAPPAIPAQSILPAFMIAELENANHHSAC